MDVIRNNLNNLVEGLKRLDQLSIANPSMNERYDEIQSIEIKKFAKESIQIIKDISRHSRD